MTLKETYTKMGGDYEDVLGRFYDEEMIGRFLRKFLDDPSFQELKAAFEEKNIRDAFCAAHTLRGICQDLAITNLCEPMHDMTELLRGEDLREAEKLLPEVEKEYKTTMDVIRSYAELY